MAVFCHQFVFAFCKAVITSFPFGDFDRASSFFILRFTIYKFAIRFHLSFFILCFCVQIVRVYKDNQGAEKLN